MKNERYLGARAKKMLAYLQANKVKVHKVVPEFHAPEGDEIYCEYGLIIVSTDPGNAEITLISDNMEVGFYELSLRKFQQQFSRLIKEYRS